MHNTVSYYWRRRRTEYMCWTASYHKRSYSHHFGHCSQKSRHIFSNYPHIHHRLNIWTVLTHAFWDSRKLTISCVWLCAIHWKEYIEINFVWIEAFELINLWTVDWPIALNDLFFFVVFFFLFQRRNIL